MQYIYICFHASLQFPIFLFQTFPVHNELISPTSYSTTSLPGATFTRSFLEQMASTTARISAWITCKESPPKSCILKYIHPKMGEKPRFLPWKINMEPKKPMCFEKEENPLPNLPVLLHQGRDDLRLQTLTNIPELMRPPWIFWMRTSPQLIFIITNHCSY